MGDTTKIEWCDHTFNPWIGCTPVSGACDHCYAEALAKRWKLADWGAGKPRVRTSPANWRKPYQWDRAALKASVRRRVFSASMADVFDAEVADAWRVELLHLIIETPNLDWLLLTKRPQVALKFVSQFGPLPANVWLGTTVEDQKMADLRIPILLSIPATKHFLSCEPLLGPVMPWTLRIACETRRLIGDGLDIAGIDWIIAGGESGPKARPSHPDWFRALRGLCSAADVPFFFKQWGEWRLQPADNGDETWPAPWFGDMPPGTGDIAHMVRVGKKASGAELDGREWREFPA